MKRLTLILIAVITLVLIVVALAFVAPGEVSIDRSIVIDAPPEVIYPFIVQFKKRLTWYPWYLADPDISLEFKGEEGHVGAVAIWEGNNQVGAGEEVITAADENRRVESTIQFIQPFESEVETDFELDPEGDQTKVTWQYRGKLNFPINIIGIFMDFEDAVGSDFKRGLENLKKVCENDARHRFNGYQVTEVEFPARVYVAFRDKVKFSDTENFLSTRLNRLQEALNAKKIATTGPPTGLFFQWDEDDQVSLMAAAVPVASPVDLGGGTEVVEVPHSKALLVTHTGPYENSVGAHQAIDAYMQKYQLTQVPPAVEEYLVGPAEEPDSAKWVTRIYYLFH